MQGGADGWVIQQEALSAQTGLHSTAASLEGGAIKEDSQMKPWQRPPFIRRDDEARDPDDLGGCYGAAMTTARGGSRDPEGKGWAGETEVGGGASHNWRGGGQRMACKSTAKVVRCLIQSEPKYQGSLARPNAQWSLLGVEAQEPEPGGGATGW